MRAKLITAAGIFFVCLFAMCLYIETEKTDFKEINKSIAKFSSKEEFFRYLSIGEEYGEYFAGYAVRAMEEPLPVEKAPLPEEMPAPAEKGVYRYSETNVQVIGIDEPDIVKTDGLRIYYSMPFPSVFLWRMPPEEITRIDKAIKGTYIIKAYPPEDIAVLSEIKDGGALLLTNNTLIVLSHGNIVGYNVLDAENPNKIWSIELDARLVAARFYKGKVYAVLSSWVSRKSRSCIFPLAYVNDRKVELRCTEIYHPAEPIRTTAIYTVAIINPKSGEFEKKVSFVGEYGSSVVYMSKNAIYITYQKRVSTANLYYKFLKEECRDILPPRVFEEIDRINSYNISAFSKMYEYRRILDEYFWTLDDDERIRVENEISNRWMKYLDKNMRKLEKTGIVKINVENLSIEAVGEIPGRLLNQFSLDEYKGYLRVATTIGRWDKSLNDVYVLDESLSVIGSVKDLGKGERIYAVRFIGDRGYVVTFRETDPFYVIDLSNPAEPKLKGELKIPGYSSYLHRIDEHLILGIGKEGANVKISLFDVSDAEKPKEVDKYILKETWSDILRTHHAFLIDRENGIFFLPGSRAGYVFSYKDGKLELVKAVDSGNVVRAVYINNYLYVISASSIVVLDESNWSRVAELKLW